MTAPQIKPRKPVPVQQGLEAKARTTVQVRRPDYNIPEFETVRETDEPIPVTLFETSPAYVRVSASATKNLGNFNSVKVQVDISLPCYPEGTEIDRVYDIASAWVNQKIQDELEFAYGRDENPPTQ